VLMSPGSATLNTVRSYPPSTYAMPGRSTVPLSPPTRLGSTAAGPA
jgi:hypothetical protein